MNRRKHWERLWVALLLATISSPARAEGFEPFSFALVGDPQIGYGRGGEYEDARRFERIGASINARKVPLTLIAGDLVQDRDLFQHWLFGLMRARIGGRVALVPGNHDVVDAASLRAFRGRHGHDYYDFVVHDCAFVAIDSETARERKISSVEHDRQWAFLETALAAHHRAGRTHIVLLMHRPPFVESESEPSSDRNWPRETRDKLLALARRYGVRWILAGHLHETRNATTTDGIQVVVSAGSARSFDRSPIAYRLFHVQRDRISHELVVVAPFPGEPFSVPGLPEWTPRLFDFSLRHWLFVLMYVLAGAQALMAARVLAKRTDLVSRASASLWRVVAVALFVLGANMQLDLDEALREIGRIAAKLVGLYRIRHLLTGAGLVVLMVTGALLLGRFYVRTGRDRALTIALGMLAVPSAWFVLSAISNHYLEMVLSEMWWDLLITLALATIALCARGARRAA
ncbi:MAG: metallophosphoesterase family protein [Polyangiales bacterium]